MVLKKPKQKRAPAVRTMYPSDGRNGDEGTEGYGLSPAVRSTVRNEDIEGRSLSGTGRSTSRDEDMACLEVLGPQIETRTVKVMACLL